MPDAGGNVEPPGAREVQSLRQTMGGRRAGWRGGSPRRAGTILAAATFLAAGCGARPDLVPAPGAQPAPPGPGAGAMGEVAGITIIARADAWSGFPENLQEVTPILVTIDNGGDAPVRIRYNEFALVAPTGKRYAAIPPFNVEGTAVESIGVRYPGFWVAPYYSHYYPFLRPYGGYFPFDRYYYDAYYPQFVRIRLPTADMIQKALPEGVLEPGGRITGYVYFENVDGDVPQVDFTAELHDAATGRPFGVVRIPFLVE